jgi:BirA family biotin operon repressor/biotin-[acetyl-CoA-carboxylase] ligase
VQVVACLIDHLLAALDRFAAHGFGAFAAAYARHDVLCGGEVELLLGAQRRCGIARGVDARGALRVEFDGREELVDSGEISLRMRR